MQSPDGSPKVSPAREGQQSQFSRGVWSVLLPINRTFTMLGYPLGLPFVAMNFMPPTPQNARHMWSFMGGLWAVASSVFYYRFPRSTVSWETRCICHFLWFMMWDLPSFWFVLCGIMLERVLRRSRCENRIFNREDPKFKGNRVVILGNGPSLAKGEPLGKFIDGMDEVVRFNNFQTKSSGLQEWTGTKTTVHFSDSMLYPSFPEYKVDGACVVLSLFMDRLIIACSYLLFRMAVDLELWRAWQMMSDPELGWMSHEDIKVLKMELGLLSTKHPTSGVLAIDWFVRHRPDPNVPVYIHGFDFFQGDQIHYYSLTEPLYERINDLLGVTLMHQPHKERAFVERLVAEGKVRWLRDLAADGK